MKKNLNYLQFLFLGTFLLLGSNLSAATTGQCYSVKELNDFKKLYIELQNQLNYELKDAYLDKNNQVQLKPHDPTKPYPGQEFELALFGEYQNSLRKVGKLFQNAKLAGIDKFSQNTDLINFMKAIENPSFNSQTDIEKLDIRKVIDALEEASKEKFANTPNASFVLNSGDKYLLEKLLIHSQDRICSVRSYEGTGNKPTKFFSANELRAIKNSPLNRIIGVIKNANITQNTVIKLNANSNVLSSKLVDPTLAIESAIAENMDKLSQWVKKVKNRNRSCMAMIKTKAFANTIQGQIQGCNFGHFMETLARDNVDNLEAVLHFINANEKFLNFKITKAETDLNERILEGFIDTTFGKLGKVKCVVLNSREGNEKLILVQNLPFDEKTGIHDTSGFSCTVKGVSLPNCSSQFDLVSDDLFRGLRVKLKDKVNSNLVLSYKGGITCSNIPTGVDDTPETKIETPETKIETPETKIETPETKIETPETKIETPETKIETPETKIETPETKIETPETKIETPEKTNDDQKKCEEQNSKWVASQDGQTPGIKYSWDAATKTCKDMKPSKDSADRSVQKAEEAVKEVFAPKAPPARFVPINIPGRSMYILPGMP